MYTLGLDISTRVIGYALLRVEESNPVDMPWSIAEFGTIDMSDHKSMADRLAHFSMWFPTVMQIATEAATHPIDWVGIEDVPMVNVRTVKAISYFVGVAIASVASEWEMHDILDQKAAFSFLDLYEKRNAGKSRSKIEIPQRGIFMPTPSHIASSIGIKSDMKDREMKKQATIDWVKDRFRLDLNSTPNNDDVADAISIAYTTVKAVTPWSGGSQC